MRERTLFDDDPDEKFPEWERDDRAECWRARVVFADGATGVFDYKIPDRLVDSVRVGERLLVPLGKSNRSVTAWCVETIFGALPTRSDGKAIRFKEVTGRIDREPLLSKKMLDLARWISERWLSPLGQTLDAILPEAIRSRAGTRLTVVWSAAADGREKIAALEKSAKTALTPKQRAVFDILAASDEPMTLDELSRSARCSSAPINALKRLGLICSRKVRREGSLFGEEKKTVERRAALALNSDQRRVLDRILEALRVGKSKTFLLHGVTGSGKTEVYIQAIRETVDSGRQAIVLVPEISLTPQTVQRFQERFDSIAVLHSHLTDAMRNVEWSRIASGSVQVVVGARSAIFAPLPHLGLIVIDEEHENSFKQETAPRYHARAVAQFRAQQENIPLILGSATPSLESFYRQQTGEYELLTLPHRVCERPLPRVELVDLRVPTEGAFTRGAIHRRLHLALAETLEKGGQAILFLNRRGFSTQIQCPACGETLKCPNCDVSLTHHRAEKIALCHYCDYQTPLPSSCPKCGSPNIKFSGFGTQRLEEELASRFPSAKVLRMDTDTMRGRDAHEKALSAFKNGDYQILLGTQMIAKGLDFPNVTLVGVISADTALHFPDFRAAERTFHLITQVAGRTGRGEKGGYVVVQSFAPEHPAIQAAVEHDYAGFAAGELVNRKRFGYPPYTEMIRLIVRGPNEAATQGFAQTLADELRAKLEQMKGDSERPFAFRLLGPTAAPFAKLRGCYRFHLHLHSADGERLRQAVSELMAQKLKAPTDVQWIADVDPLDML